jgi:hypothetical protein
MVLKAWGSNYSPRQLFESKKRAKIDDFAGSGGIQPATYGL